ncbi:MAG: hypothetical protein M3P27_11835 [Acidobacteriota bacterium]|nr:hypothetical protein [Acidobacteriota bacterium]
MKPIEGGGLNAVKLVEGGGLNAVKLVALPGTPGVGFVGVMQVAHAGTPKRWALA